MKKIYKDTLSDLRDLGKSVQDVIGSVLRGQFSLPESGIWVEQLREFEDNVMMITHYLGSQLQHGSRPQFYDLTPVKKTLRIVFKAIYDGEFMLEQMLENPLAVSPSALLNTLPLQQIPSLLMNNLTDTTTVTAVGFFYPDQGQFITTNNHFHIFPRPTNPECFWLSMTDIDEEYLIAMLAADHAFLGMGNETIFIDRAGSIWQMLSDTTKTPLDLPFLQGLATCSRDGLGSINCESSMTTMRMTFDQENNFATIFASMKINKHTDTILRGLVGKPEASGHVYSRGLPDNTDAQNEETFLNAFEITGHPECQFSPEDITPSVDPQSASYILCESVLARFQNIPAVSTSLYNAYLEACSSKAITREDTCKYTNMLVADLQYKGVPVNKYSYCTTCGMEDPVSSVLTKPRVIIAISMSNDTVAMNPKDILRGIVQQVTGAMENVEITFVAYGANDEFYPPYIRTVNGRISTADLSDLKTSISQMQFTGPSYDSSSTISALEFIAGNFHDCHKGVATSVVIVAPETMKQSMAGLLPGNLVPRITGELTQVNMISMLSNQHCIGFGLDIFSHTTGQCYLPSQVSSTVGDIVQHLSGNIGRSTLCSCLYVYPSEAALLTMCRFI
ncbi:uncharacterized protein LOC100183498 [Ciona intestinalis]